MDTTNQITTECRRCHAPMMLQVPEDCDRETAIALARMTFCDFCESAITHASLQDATRPKTQATRTPPALPANPRGCPND